MNTTATLKAVRVSTRKVRLVADSIRNMSTKDALSTLSITNKRGAHVLIKVIRSAIANAVNNGKLAEDTLVFDRLDIQEGPFLKRFHPSTRGRVHPFKKRSTHITIVLKAKEPKTITKTVEVKKEEKGKDGKKD